MACGRAGLGGHFADPLRGHIARQQGLKDVGFPEPARARRRKHGVQHCPGTGTPC